MTKKNIFTIIFFILFFIVNIYISWFFVIFEIIISIIIYNLIAYSFYFLWKKVRKGKSLLFNEFTKLFLYKLSNILTLLILLVWSFTYYQNNINPAQMPIYKISNGKKEVVFQSMSHIWSQNFYNSVINSIKKLKTKGYVLFFEWVKPWSEKSNADFNKALWVDFNEDIYKNFSKLYWVIHQDNSQFIWLVNNLDFNVDLDLDKIMEIYNKKTKKSKDTWNKLPNEVIDINSEIIKTLAQLNNNQLAILRYINQSILNFIIKNDAFRDTILENFWNNNLFDVILDDRNKHLVNEINNSKYDKIVITYWLMHFTWVLELLKENDKNWEIETIDYLYPIK